MAQQLFTGVVYREDRLEWTALRGSKGRWETAGHGEDPLSEPIPAALKSLHGRLGGRLCLGIPTGKALLRVVDLPTREPEEIRGMVDLQVDKFSPFPIEHMAVAHEVLEQKEAGSRVLIAAVQREIVEDLGTLFLKAGRRPHQVDVEVMGWWALLKQNQKVPEKGRRVFVLLNRDGAELLVSQDGAPVLIRSLGVGGDDEAALEELVEEIGYTLTSLEAEWGAVEASHASLWHWSGQAQPAEALAKTLRQSFELEITRHLLDELPPLSEGLARRAATSGALDLSRPEWRQQEQSRKTRKGLIVSSAIFLGLWMAGIAAFLFALHYQGARLAALKNAVEQLEQPAQEVALLQDKIKTFRQYANRTHSALECLLQVTLVMPEGLDLNSFTYRKGASLNLRGESPTAEPVYNFFQALESSKFYTEVKPETVVTRMQGNVPRAQFGVTLGLPGEKP